MIPGRCKEVGIRKVSYELTLREIVSHLLGKKAYRKTRYLLFNKNKNWAIVSIRKKGKTGEILHRITGVRILSLPADTGFIRDPAVDVLNPSQMAALSEKSEKRYLVVHGKYEHISFVTGEKRTAIRVVDIIPPLPPHLADLAKQAIACGMIRAPVRIETVLINLRTLAKKTSAVNIMFPCSYSATKQKNTYFLNRCPDIPKETLRKIILIGCNRSEKIFRTVYGLKPKRISMCPLDILKSFSRNDAKVPTIAHCCELKKKVQLRGSVVLVPWDADLPQVADALNKLVRR